MLTGKISIMTIFVIIALVIVVGTTVYILRDKMTSGGLFEKVEDEEDTEEKENR